MVSKTRGRHPDPGGRQHPLPRARPEYRWPRCYKGPFKSLGQAIWSCARPVDRRERDFRHPLFRAWQASLYDPLDVVIPQGGAGTKTGAAPTASAPPAPPFFGCEGAAVRQRPLRVEAAGIRCEGTGWSGVEVCGSGGSNTQKRVFGPYTRDILRIKHIRGLSFLTTD